MRDADENEYREGGRFWNKREGEEDNGRLRDEVRAKDAWKMKKKKHIEYLSANNVYSTRIESLVLSTFPFASLSNTCYHTSRHTTSLFLCLS